MLYRNFDQENKSSAFLSNNLVMFLQGLIVTRPDVKYQMCRETYELIRLLHASLLAQKYKIHHNRYNGILTACLVSKSRR